MARGRERRVRQWGVIEALRSRRRGLTIGELIDLTGASRATVYRDIEVLEHARIPITSERSAGEVRYRLMDGARRSLALEPHEIAARVLARRLLDPLPRTRGDGSKATLYISTYTVASPHTRGWTSDAPSATCYALLVNDPAEKLYDEALKLDPEERSVLALRLLDSVGEPEESIERAWAEEVRSRLQDIDAGRVELSPWEEAKKRIFAPR